MIYEIRICTIKYARLRTDRTTRVAPPREKEIEIETGDHAVGASPSQSHRQVGCLTKPTTAKKKKGVTAKMAEMELLPAAENPAQLIPPATRKSLAAWFELYMKLEGSANADATW